MIDGKKVLAAVTYEIGKPVVMENVSSNIRMKAKS
jgi:hypothetical protein